MTRQALVLLLTVTQVYALEIRVSPEVGSSIQTLSQAMEAVRKAGRHEPITLRLAPGTYTLDAPLVFTPEDGGRAGAPVTWKGDEGAVISGGVRLPPFQPGPDGCWSVTVPETVLEKGLFTQIFVNGRRAVRAREPDTGYFYVSSVDEDRLPKGSPHAARQTIGVKEAADQLLQGVSPEAIRRTDVIFYHKWDTTWRALTGYDAKSRAFTIEGRIMKSWNPLKTGGRFHLEHWRAALDEAGEWFLEADGTLLYKPRPGETPDRTRAVIPISPQWLVIKGDPAQNRFVEHLQFENLTFRHAAYRLPRGGYGPVQAAAELEAAVQLDGVRRVDFKDCTFEHAGLYGIWYRQGCSESRVERCQVLDLGGGGVRIGDMRFPGNNVAVTTHHITVHDNIIARGGRLFPCAVGVWIGHSPDNTVTHNDIADFLYTGISVGWRWGYTNSAAKRNRIAYNHVHHIGQGVLSDMGGIYTLGPSEGTRIDHNIFHDIYAYSYGGWGLYTDEGSSHIVMENNLVYNTKTGGFHQHYGRDNIVRNNIFAFAKLQQLQYTRAEAHLSFAFTGNIVLWEEGNLMSGRWKDGKVLVDSNCYWRVDGKPFHVLGESFEAWKERGRDTHSIIADPKFSDPAQRKFDLPEDSPALKIGFKPFDVSTAGVLGEDRRKRARAMTIPACPPPP